MMFVIVFSVTIHILLAFSLCLRGINTRSWTGNNSCELTELLLIPERVFIPFSFPSLPFYKEVYWFTPKVNYVKVELFYT